MAIRKSDLRDFIEVKAKARKNELRKVVVQVVETAIKPVIFEIYKEAEEAESLGARLHSSLLKLQEQHKHFRDVYHFSRVIRELDQHIVSARMDIVRRQAGYIVFNLLDRGTDGFMKELIGLVADIASANAKTIQEYQDLVKLTEELTTIIDSSHNGDKAFKRLESICRASMLGARTCPQLLSSR